MSDLTEPPSAIARVWAMPEIVIAIMQDLKRERVDLLRLSLTSKFLRRLAVTMLVRDLDVPLSKAGKIAYLLERRSDLVTEIKHIRVWDEESHYQHRWRGDLRPEPIISKQIRAEYDHPPEAHPLDQQTSSKWHAAQKLLHLVFSSADRQLPTLDLSFGIGTVGSFKLALARSGFALWSIVGLRVLVDYFDAEQLSAEPSSVWKGLTGLAQWDAVKGLVQDITAAQRDSPAPKLLQVFHIEDCSQAVEGRHSMQSFVWNGLAAELCSTLRSLRLHLSVADLKGYTGFVNDSHGGPLARDWPQLRHITFILPRWTEAPLQPFIVSLSGFFQHHSLLEDIEIFGDADFSEPVFTADFPELRALSIASTSFALLAPFLSRHANLTAATAGRSSFRLFPRCALCVLPLACFEPSLLAVHTPPRSSSAKTIMGPLICRAGFQLNRLRPMR
ncbi:hypothetical protein V8E36_009312 [Tilletia maclaganii]